MEKISSIIDHTCLKPDTDKSAIIKLCQEAVDYGFKTICVNPFWVKLAADKLKGKIPGVTAVAGFPLGANAIETKISEVDKAISDGADEIDMVMNIGLFKSGEINTVYKEINSIKKIMKNKILKVIIEICLLNNNEIIEACMISEEAGADFVKTSTGFSTGGADTKTIVLMRNTIGPQTSVKASGGIKTLKDVQDMVAAGASRIGTSSGVSIMKELDMQHSF